jgi:hypothetical protein
MDKEVHMRTWMTQMQVLLWVALRVLYIYIYLRCDRLSRTTWPLVTHGPTHGGECSMTMTCPSCGMFSACGFRKAFRGAQRNDRATCSLRLRLLNVPEPSLVPCSCCNTPTTPVEVPGFCAITSLVAKSFRRCAVRCEQRTEGPRP